MVEALGGSTESAKFGGHFKNGDEMTIVMEER